MKIRYVTWIDWPGGYCVMIKTPHQTYAVSVARRSSDVYADAKFDLLAFDHAEANESLWRRIRANDAGLYQEACDQGFVAPEWQR